MKPDLDKIACKMHEKGFESFQSITEDMIAETLINEIEPQIQAWKAEVLEKLQTLEHPEPRNRAEYNERYGIEE